MTTQNTTEQQTEKHAQNFIEMTGNTAHIPNFKYTPSGKAVADVTCYCTRRWGDNREFEETVEIKVTFWGDLAEQVHETIGKGDLIWFNGRLGKTEGWVSKTKLDKEGNPLIEARSTMTAFAFGIKFKKGGNQQQPAPQSAPKAEPSRDPAQEFPENMGDIPF